MSFLRGVLLRLALGIGLCVSPCLVAAAVAQTITSGDPIQQIVIEGNQRIESDTIRSYMELNPGDPFDAARVDKALKNLFATGLFADVNLRRDGNNLVVTVVENPIINKLAFEGNSRISDDSLSNEVQLKPRQVYTQTRVQADVKRILDLYRRSGRFAATVDPKVIKLDQNRVNLVFEINEGDVTQVERIDFVGNKHFSDSTLREQIATKESAFYRFLSTTDTYDPDRLTVDKEDLRKFYLSEGYADFRVISSVAELSPDQEAFFITFTVEEGERYKLGKVDIKTTLKDLDPKTLWSDVTTEEGDWYDASKVDDTVQALSDRVGSLGYAFVDVRPRIDRDPKKHILNLTYDIQEGPKVYVERIDISGNVRTQDKVIRREFRLAEGDAFSTAKLRRTEQRLRNLGFFETVDISTVPSTSPDKTIIKVKVKEQSTGELTFGAGFSTALGPLGSVGLRERNLLGKGMDVQANITISGKESSGSVSFTDPYFLDKDISAGFDIFYRRLDPGTYLERDGGFALRMGYDLSEYLRNTLSYKLTADRIYNVDHRDAQSIKDEKGYDFRQIVESKLSYDRRDNLQDPRSGYYVTLDTNFAIPNPAADLGLGQNVRYISGTLQGAYYYPVTKDITLQVSNEVGYIQPLFGDYLHYPDGFFLGGSSGVGSLRGFKERGAGPREASAKRSSGSIGGQFLWDGTVQGTFPLGLPQEYQIRGRVFSDFGIVTGTNVKHSNNEPIDDDASIRASLGGGITWISPFGPLAIDLAYPVLKKSQDQTEYFSFSFGTNF
jgi:outer membrane protein insertion porin family